MKVFYCKYCNKYFFIRYRKDLRCPTCLRDLVQLPIDYLDFVELDRDQREEYFKSLKF